MYIGIKHLHSFTAYLSLAFLTIAVISTFYCWIANKSFSKRSKVVSLLGLMGAHIQMLLGLLLYFVSPLGLSNFSGESMKSSSARLYILEHPLMMLVAIGLITYGYSKGKRAKSDNNKHVNVAIFYTLGLVAILLMIPWNAWI